MGGGGVFKEGVEVGGTGLSCWEFFRDRNQG